MNVEQHSRFAVQHWADGIAAPSAGIGFYCAAFEGVVPKTHPNALPDNARVFSPRQAFATLHHRGRHVWFESIA